MTGYDIIGDIHGCATKLDGLLGELGYRINNWTGAYWHPKRQAVFVGDLIDRGPEQIRVLQIVKRMVDSGSAHIVMGNHEFNAIAYATEWPDGSGTFLRAHNPKKYGQHRDFLDQVTGVERAHYLEWFKTLPLWLDLGGVRIVHACWHEPSMTLVKQELGTNRFNSTEQFARAATKGNPLYDAIEILLKGPEISLTDHGQPPYMDKDRNTRDKARIRWWNEDATTLRDLAELSGNYTTEAGEPYPELPAIPIDESERSFVYGGGAPVFYGHYWRQGSPEHLLDWTKHTACVDFSAVKGGTLVAYRWSGETEIQHDHYLPHESDLVAPKPSA
ncbi:UNVERIFIED_CONTAM: calcineurin-like phosphoesterase family protein [Williamsia faeni]